MRNQGVLGAVPFLPIKDLWICGMTPPPAIVALMRESSSSSPRIASWRCLGVILFTFKSLLAFPANSKTCNKHRFNRGLQKAKNIKAALLYLKLFERLVFYVAYTHMICNQDCNKGQLNLKAYLVFFLQFDLWHYCYTI